MKLLPMIILALFDVIQYYIIINKLHNDKIRFTYLGVTSIGVVAIMTGIGATYILPQYVFFINALWYIIMNIVLYRNTFFQVIIIHLMSVSLIQTMQIIVITTLSLLGLVTGGYFENYKDFKIGVLVQSGSLLLLLMTIKFINLKAFYHYIEKRNFLFRAIIVNLSIVSTGIVFYWFHGKHTYLSTLLIMGIVSLALIIVNGVVLNNGLRDIKIERQHDMYEQYLPVLNQLLDEVRQRQHDIDNHLSALRLVVTDKHHNSAEVQEINSYLDQIEINRDLKALLGIRNRLLAALLYSKKKEAEKQGITLEINNENCEINSALPDHDLIETVGILVDNAIEASGEGQTVSVCISMVGNSILITVANQHDYIKTHEINRMFRKGYSTKTGNNCGFGLYKLKKIISAYNGQIEIENQRINELNYILFSIKV